MVPWRSFSGSSMKKTRSASTPSRSSDGGAPRSYFASCGPGRGTVWCPWSLRERCPSGPVLPVLASRASGSDQPATLCPLGLDRCQCRAHRCGNAGVLPTGGGSGPQEPSGGSGGLGFGSGKQKPTKRREGHLQAEVVQGRPQALMGGGIVGCYGGVGRLR